VSLRSLNWRERPIADIGPEQQPGPVVAISHSPSMKLFEITPNGARFGQPGYETDLLYLACLVALVLGGSP